ncbi:uncharacterized protein PY17X_0700047 [Plasmodium yoelii]|uniref:PIR protein n=2 Tax=Plasmodium yoelii TaxID=5861 RepID=A0AAF0B3L9_PLAYO|nr:uncharacterized protein PY17X_0700047 [Plasmodium yoelii]WBY56189.1 PIR protein [Plasmodium yoelii yoelii]CDU17370.1 YIR protein [Plasmodium yoelii]VTZ76133.1 PIR protein [Plasmodium yoelii]|eukprot:XP_731141.2 uncharacterized protein PY17X_0700047 [Plasmodium yoelii]
MSKGLCDAINLADNYIFGDPNNSRENGYESFFDSYCPDDNCDTDNNKVSSTFISLLKIFEDESLESDKLAEYASLWLSHKANQKPQNGTTKLYDFYTSYVLTNNKYDDKIFTNNKINMEVISKKIESMDIDIKDISNFYDAFKSLCNMYSEFDPEKNNECKTCLETAGELVEKYEKLKNALDINKGSSYYKLLSSLSNDYKIYGQIYNSVCNNSSPFVACPRSSVTKNTLITIAIIFVAASILLVVSYKYSLFGFRKRSQKHHLREMLKK